MVVRVQNAKTKQYEPYMCAIYSLENYEDVDQMEIMTHDNGKSTDRSYIRTSKAVFERQHNLLTNGRRLNEVYDILIEVSGGPFESAWNSNELRNMKQIRN